jgi:hypothetical protein
VKSSPLPSKARAAFSDLGRQRDSRFAAIAPARVADCLWMEGKRDEAAAAYRKLLGGKPAFDQAVRVFAWQKCRPRQRARAKDRKAATEAAARAFMQIHVDFPAHPLGRRGWQARRPCWPRQG